MKRVLFVWLCALTACLASAQVERVTLSRGSAMPQLLTVPMAGVELTHLTTCGPSTSSTTANLTDLGVNFQPGE